MVAVIVDAFCDGDEEVPGFQSAGGLINTMPPHLGQARILPMADSSRTFSRVWHVVQGRANSSTKLRLCRNESMLTASHSISIMIRIVRYVFFPEKGAGKLYFRSSAF